jgi:HK97 family phage major capsid protein
MPPEVEKPPAQDPLPEGAVGKQIKDQIREVAELTKQVQAELDKLKTSADGNTEEISRLSRELDEKNAQLIKDVDARLNRFSVPGAESLLSEKNDSHRWNLGRFLQGVKDGRLRDGPEKELHEAFMEQLSTSDDLMVRAMATTPAADGGFWVPNNILWDRLIPVVRANSVLLKLGITTLPGLVGTVSIPRIVTAATSYMIGENEPPTESSMTLGELTMYQHDVGALMLLSNRLLSQSVVAAEKVARSQMGRGLGLKMDQQGLEGSGADKQTIGVLNSPNIGEVDFSSEDGNESDDIYDLLVDAQEELPVQDVGEESEDTIGWSPAWVIHPKFVRILRKLKTHNTGADHHEYQRVMFSEKPWTQLLGTPFYRTTQLTEYTGGTPSMLRSHDVYGNWAELYLGQFAPLSIALSKEYKFTERQTAFLATLGFDWGIAHEESFVKLKGVPHAIDS